MLQKRIRRLYTEMRLQLRNKTPKRRMKAKLRDDQMARFTWGRSWCLPIDAPNELDEFLPMIALLKMVAHKTDFWRREAYFDLAIILDFYARRVVGKSASNRLMHD